MLSVDAGALGDIVDDDLFRADVTVAGSMSYDTQIGESTTTPRLTERAGPTLANAQATLALAKALENSKPAALTAATRAVRAHL